MRNLVICVALAAVCAAATAEELNGRKIQLKAGPSMALNPPLSLPFDGKVDGIIVVSEPSTGKEFPGTVRNGEFVFVPEGAVGNTEHSYVVKVQPPRATKAPIVRVEKHADENVIDVFLEDQLLTSYYYLAGLKKPYLWPLNGEGGVTVTRDFPMKPEGTPKMAQDHIHHKSMWTSYGDINGADCWMEDAGSGKQESGEVTFGSGDAYGWIHAKNTWKDKDGKPVVDEEREYRFYAAPANARLIDVSVTFTANHGPAKFIDTKEGGIVSIRMRPELSFAKGTISNAEGEQGEKLCWGKPSKWCDYSGDMGGTTGVRGVTIFDNPKNLRYPTAWHVRAYGLMGANCFGYSHFSKVETNKGKVPENGDYTIEAGKAQAFNYRVYVHSGDVNAAKVADRYADYATPPQVKWAD